jgi:hypothetical protein
MHTLNEQKQIHADTYMYTRTHDFLYICKRYLYVSIYTSNTVGEKPAEKPALQALSDEILSTPTPKVSKDKPAAAVAFTGAKK